MKNDQVKRFLLFDIGCIECGSESGIVGMFDTQEEAETAQYKCYTKLDWHDGGQHHFTVYDLHKPIQQIYINALNDTEVTP